MGYLLDNCKLEKLSNEIINQCQPYSCKKDIGIDYFFHTNRPDNYEDYEAEMMGYTYCFFSTGQDGSGQMVCAFSLSNASLRTDILPHNTRNKYNKSIPNNKRRAQYPAILIGKLCVFDGYGKHLLGFSVGDEMMDLIKTIAINPDNHSAARFLVVDAINDPNVISYYLRNGFHFLFSSEEEELSSLQESKMGFGSCKTRLMIFDLILLKP